MKVFLGYDAVERRAFNVAVASILRVTSQFPYIQTIDLSVLQERGLYRRPTFPSHRGGYFDEISAAPMSTGHAIARFLVPELCGWIGWAMFADSDIIVRRELEDLWACRDDRYAVMCVKHEQTEGDGLKKTGQLQQFYARKNWSSVILWNCGHPANRALTNKKVNTVPGRDLHAFDWLDDELIGALDPCWNHLVGVEQVADIGGDVAIAHFTLGTPDISDISPPMESGSWERSLINEWNTFDRVLRPVGLEVAQV